jgi:hypothetical protein
MDGWLLTSTLDATIWLQPSPYLRSKMVTVLEAIPRLSGHLLNLCGKRGLNATVKPWFLTYLKNVTLKTKELAERYSPQLKMDLILVVETYVLIKNHLMEIKIVHH